MFYFMEEFEKDCHKFFLKCLVENISEDTWSLFSLLKAV